MARIMSNGSHYEEWFKTIYMQSVTRPPTHPRSVTRHQFMSSVTHPRSVTRQPHPQSVTRQPRTRDQSHDSNAHILQNIQHNIHYLPTSATPHVALYLHPVTPGAPYDISFTHTFIRFLPLPSDLKPLLYHFQKN